MVKFTLYRYGGKSAHPAPVPVLLTVACRGNHGPPSQPKRYRSGRRSYACDPNITFEEMKTTRDSQAIYNDTIDLLKDLDERQLAAVHAIIVELTAKNEGWRSPLGIV